MIFDSDTAKYWDLVIKVVGILAAIGALALLAAAAWLIWFVITGVSVCWGSC